VPEKEYRQSEETAQTSKFQFPITKIVDPSKLFIQGNELQGPHPVHGSSGGRNFSVNLEKNIWHCWRHSTGGGALSWLAVKEGILKCEEAVSHALTGVAFRKTLDIAVKQGLLTEEETRQNPREYFQINPDTGRLTFVPKLLADAVTAKYTFKTRRDNNETYVYSEGVYKPYGLSVVREECVFELGERYRKHYADEVVDYVKSSTYSVFEEPPLHLVNLENGILNLKTKTLEPHSPQYVFLHKLSVAYNKTSTCPKIEKFLQEIASTPEEASTLLDFIAYTLYREYVFHKALLLIGVGENGKSVFLNLTQKFLGDHNVSNRSLQELATDRFGSSDLYGKLANVCGDLPNTALRNTGTFKMLVGNDVVTAQKKFIGAFKFRN